MGNSVKRLSVGLLLAGLFAFSGLGLVAQTSFEPIVGLELVAEGLVAPVGLVSPEDGTGRLFIVDQIGVVKILTADGELLEEPFLDLRDRMVNLRGQYDERGLLGLAFHPNFEKNGRFFVYYSSPLRDEAPADWDHTSHLSEFRLSGEDPNRADPDSERILLQVDQPQGNHNAGQLAFGPDGYLYISLGDGGGADDAGIGHPPIGNGQDISTLLGSILRIDVDSGDPYGIPPDNPFLGRAGRDEIFAYGLRNPFRFSFDAGGDQELFVGDVGQNLFEEVNIVTKGGDYGWNIREGLHCFDPGNPDQPPTDCPDTGASGEPLLDPIIEYPHPGLPGGIGTTVIGGFVYCGSALPGFEGRYIFGDWSTGFDQGDGTLLIARPPSSDGESWSMEELRVATSMNGRLDAFLLAFGQDAHRELYVLTSETLGPTGDTGKVFKLTPAEAWEGEIDGAIGEEEYHHMTEVVGVEVYWYNDAENIYVGLVSPGKGYVDIGFDPERRMQGANLILTAVKEGEVVSRDDYGVAQTNHAPDTGLGGEDNVLEAAGLEDENGTVTEFVIPLDSGDRYDKALEPGESYTIIVSYHRTSDSFSTYHSERGYGEITLDKLE